MGASTNDVATFTNHDNATYWWRKDVRDGAWEDANSWSNSHNDARLTWPTDKYTTADFSQVDVTSSVTVRVSASHVPTWVWAPKTARMVYTGTSGVTLDLAGSGHAVTGEGWTPHYSGSFAGTCTVDRIAFRFPATSFAANARMAFRDGASGSCGGTLSLCAAGAELVLQGGATFAMTSAGYHELSAGARIVLDGGAVTDSGYFVWSCSQSVQAGGELVFTANGGYFNARSAHNVVHSIATPFRLRYELPAEKWTTAFDAAPLRPGFVTDGHRFGANGAFHAEITATGDLPRAGRELRLISAMSDLAPNALIATNGFTFAAFGESLRIGQRSSRGDYFYWTWGYGSELRAPAIEGALPTGLKFHFAPRPGTILSVR